VLFAGQLIPNHRRSPIISARDFINDTLLPALSDAIADEARGNKHYLRGFDDALKAVARYLEESRHRWDVPE